MSSWKKNGSACKPRSSAPSRLARRDGNSSGVCGATSCSGFMCNSNLASNLTPCTTCSPPEAALPKSAKIELNYRVHVVFKTSLLKPDVYKTQLYTRSNRNRSCDGLLTRLSKWSSFYNI